MQAFLDTTMIADAVLKDSGIRKKTVAAIKLCREAQYPTYALKEFDLGAFNSYRLFHNYLLEENSIIAALHRVHAGILTPQKGRFATMIEAWIRAEEDSMVKMPKDQRPNDRERAREMRWHLKALITTAHQQIRALATEVYPLACYGPLSIEELPNKMIAFSKSDCGDGVCSVAEQCKSVPGAANKLIPVLEREPASRETNRRLAALEKLQTQTPLSNSDCRDLGDAVFAILAPEGFVIVTTNVRHHRPLAHALGKEALHPEDVK